MDNSKSCVVCKNHLDENLTILCDNFSCGNEVHMYCLEQELFKLPDGDWFCNSCRGGGGDTDALIHYFSEHSGLINQYNNIDQGYSNQLLELWSLKLWLKKSTQLYRNAKEMMSKSEFDFTNLWKYNGSILQLILPGTLQSHVGRITSSRLKGKNDISEIEFLVRFKSGANDRNVGLDMWLNPNHHCCLIGSEIVWISQDRTRWLGQVFLRSGLFNILNDPLSQNYLCEREPRLETSSSLRSCRSSNSSKAAIPDHSFVPDLAQQPFTGASAGTVLVQRLEDLSFHFVPRELIVEEAELSQLQSTDCLRKWKSVSALLAVIELEEIQRTKDINAIQMKQRAESNNSSSCGLDYSVDGLDVRAMRSLAEDTGAVLPDGNHDSEGRGGLEGSDCCEGSVRPHFLVPGLLPSLPSDSSSSSSSIYCEGSLSRDGAWVKTEVAVSAGTQISEECLKSLSMIGSDSDAVSGEPEVNCPSGDATEGAECHRIHPADQPAVTVALAKETHRAPISGDPEGVVHRCKETQDREAFVITALDAMDSDIDPAQAIASRAVLLDTVYLRNLGLHTVIVNDTSINGSSCSLVGADAGDLNWKFSAVTPGLKVGITVGYAGDVPLVSSKVSGLSTERTIEAVGGGTIDASTQGPPRSICRVRDCNLSEMLLGLANDSTSDSEEEQEIGKIISVNGAEESMRVTHNTDDCDDKKDEVGDTSYRDVGVYSSHAADTSSILLPRKSSNDSDSTYSRPVRKSKSSEPYRNDVKTSPPEASLQSSERFNGLPLEVLKNDPVTKNNRYVEWGDGLGRVPKEPAVRQFYSAYQPAKNRNSRKGGNHDRSCWESLTKTLGQARRTHIVFGEETGSEMRDPLYTESVPRSYKRSNDESGVTSRRSHPPADYNRIRDWRERSESHHRDREVPNRISADDEPVVYSGPRKKFRQDLPEERCGDRIGRPSIGNNRDKHSHSNHSLAKMARPREWSTDRGKDDYKMSNPLSSRRSILKPSSKSDEISMAGNGSPAVIVTSRDSTDAAIESFLNEIASSKKKAEDSAACRLPTTPSNDLIDDFLREIETFKRNSFNL